MNQDFKEEMIKEKELFEEDFVRLNCEIQQIRSDNESLIDEIKNREEVLKNLEQEISQKSALVNVLEKKINEIKNN